MTTAVSAFTTSVFQTVDSMDADGVAARFAPDGSITFGNQRALVGTADIHNGNAQFFDSIKGIHHKVQHEWTVGSDTVVELEVTYDRLDGHSVTIPCVSIWTLDDDGLFSSYRVFFDLAPVFG